MTEGAARYGPPTLVLPRLGRGTFRVIVRDNYDRRCAVTGERTLPALDAAHIRPYAEGGLHAASNGILFRRDIHSLFDAGYVTVTKGHMFEVSRRIREEFENGRHYYAMHGTPLSVPDRADRRPDPRMLEWHNTARFRGYVMARTMSKSSTTTMRRSEPIHPGEFLADDVAELALSAAGLARLLRVPANRVSQILAGRRAVSADTALRLGLYFGTGPNLWLNLQKTYELDVAHASAGRNLDRIQPRGSTAG